ncbi:replicative DNA helicase [Candidimonas humi]|uniref:Replicative DNA helicase n=1 Tax=Candidimonas humi TaxID=683355 RepID=A0ABV8NWE2_9BURK|nr:replicative DNA helicase [Candidimonas humi]MBV6304917.1 replicative DNA helicase [Candidimonas humi]
MTDRPNIPAHNADAEQAVLGGLLLENRAWEALDGLLADGDFYVHSHRLIFRQIAGLLDQGRPADVLTVSDALIAAGCAEEAGGLAYLNALAQNVPSVANIRRYAQIVRDERVRRDVEGLGRQICTLATDRSYDASGLLDRATGLAMGIADSRQAGKEPQAIGELLHGFVETLEERTSREGGISGTSTGFRDLDWRTCGLQAGDLIILAGRPSMGKTALAYNIAENVALGGGVSLVFSLEMSAAQLAERSVARFGAIDMQRLRSGKLSQDDWGRLTGSFSRLQDQNLIIVDDPNVTTVPRMRLGARKQKQRLGALNLIVVDYLQLMEGEGSNRNEELGGVTRALKHLAREMNCPVIVLSQLSREVEKRTDKRPIMSDLRESGAIEQDGDVVMMCYRDDYYNPDSPWKGFAEILIRKQRMGPLGDVHLVFEGQHSRFLNADTSAIAAVRNELASQPARARRRGFEA